jgi:hypothetical protein
MDLSHYRLLQVLFLSPMDCLVYQIVLERAGSRGDRESFISRVELLLRHNAKRINGKRLANCTGHYSTSLLHLTTPPHYSTSTPGDVAASRML